MPHRPDGMLPGVSPKDSPPHVVPHPLSLSGGGVTWSSQNFSLRLIVLLCGSLCCGALLHSWQDILLTFAEMALDSTTMFPPGTNVMLIPSPGEPVLAQVVGHWEHGDAYRRITYDRVGRRSCTTVRPFGASQVCVYSGGAVSRGGGGASLGNRPRGGGGGLSSLGWGTRGKGGPVAMLQ